MYTKLGNCKESRYKIVHYKKNLLHIFNINNINQFKQYLLFMCIQQVHNSIIVFNIYHGMDRRIFTKINRIT